MARVRHNPGRKTLGRRPTVPLAHDEILPPNPDRLRLVFSAPLVNPVIVGFDLGGGVFAGVILHPGMAPFVFDYDDYGSVVQAAVRAQSAVAAQPIHILEVEAE